MGSGFDSRPTHFHLFFLMDSFYSISDAATSTIHVATIQSQGQLDDTGNKAVISVACDNNVNEQQQQLSQMEQQIESSAIVCKLNEEITRLRTFLIQQDKDFGDECERNRQRIDELEKELEIERIKNGQFSALTNAPSQLNTTPPISQRPDQIANQQYQQSLERTLERLRTENSDLQHRISHTKAELDEREETAQNLQTALNLLQVSTQNEINMQVAAFKKETELYKTKYLEIVGERDSLRDQLGEHHQQNSQSCLDSDRCTMEKLISDLDAHNCLIDQLNEEINQLKKSLQSIRTGKHPEFIEKRFLKSVLLSLGAIDKRSKYREILSILCSSLDIPFDEILELRISLRSGGLDSSSENTSTSLFSPRKGLTDYWMSFLLSESVVDSDNGHEDGDIAIDNQHNISSGIILV